MLPPVMPDRHNNFDLLRLVAAISVVFSHAFLLGEGRQANEPLMVLTGGQCVLGVAGGSLIPVCFSEAAIA